MKNFLFLLVASVFNTNLGAQVLLKNYPGELFLYCHSNDTFILIDSLPQKIMTDDSYFGFPDLKGKIIRQEINSGFASFDTIEYIYAECNSQSIKRMNRLNKSIPLGKSDAIDFVFQDDTIHLEIHKNGNIVA